MPVRAVRREGTVGVVIAQMYYGRPGHCFDADGCLWHEPGECIGAPVNCNGKCCGYMPEEEPMAESWKDQLSRVRMMANGDPKWDLSDNDIAAIKAVLDRVESTNVAPVAMTTDEQFGPAWPVPGNLYKHYKGDLYFVLFIAAHHDSRAEQVIYLSLAKGSVNVRPLRGSEQDPDGWLVPVDGKPRFARVTT